MKDLIIYGAGGFGRETRLMIEQINEDRPQWNVIGFVDDGKKAGVVVDDLEVLGGRDYLLQRSSTISVVLALADPQLRKRVAQNLQSTLLDFPVLIHPNVQLGDKRRNSFGEGTIVSEGNILTTSVSLGRFVILNLACTVGHDVMVRDFASIMPGCHISGSVSIGEGTFIGTGARLIQNLSIGSWCKIGAGAVVTKSFGDGLRILGIPAKEK